MKTLDRDLWLYLQPERIEDFIGYENQLRPLLNIKMGTVLFSAPYGCGKTSAARALAHTVMGQPMPVLGKVTSENGVFAGHWNAQDFDVDTLNDKRMVPMFHNRAILILDEAQEFNAKQQNKIQSYIEREGTYSKLVCLCTYEPQKLNPALQSRCRKVRLGPLAGKQREELAMRGWRALEMEGALPLDELFAEFDKYDGKGETAGRAILRAVEDIANGLSVREAVKGTRPAV